MEALPSPRSLHLVSRRTRMGFGQHYGLAFHFHDGQTLVYDFSSQSIVYSPSGRYQLRPLHEFLGGAEPQWEWSTCCPAEIAQAIRRFKELDLLPWMTRYSLFDWNCEHMARFVAEGRAISTQVDEVKARLRGFLDAALVPSLIALGLLAAATADA